MLKSKIIQKNYTFNSSGYQLKLPIELSPIIPENDSVRLVSQFVEEMDLTELYHTYDKIRKSSVAPKTMLKIIIYGAMNRLYSSRDIERACRRDINFMYLLEGATAPDHATIARFKSLHFSECSENFLSQMSENLFRCGEISGKDIFIDGTKIESCANKYTFVWKKAVIKSNARLEAKAAVFVEDCEEMFGIRVATDNTVSLHTLKRLRKKLYRIKDEEGIEFVHGIGKRKSELQKFTEQLEEYISKLKEYVSKVHICGNRNSYSKTDPDATFMRMKEDAMLNGQLKPAYNLQHGVDSEYIVWLSIGPQPTDTTTLIPFMKSMESHLSFKYENVVADAGYESEENYVFLESNGQTAFIKPANYEQTKKRKYRNDIGRYENMEYCDEGDYYICHNGRFLRPSDIKRSKTKTGYIRTTTIYHCDDCTGCPYKTECIKGNNCHTSFEDRSKRLDISKTFIAKRKEALERIMSDEGCMLRMNRSIQAEGSFSEVKDGMGFRRYLSRGKKNVLAESIIVAMARNMNKLHSRIQGDRAGMHLYQLKSA